MHDLAADVDSLLDQLNIESAILIGLSVGGMIALQTALDFPNRVRALVLCDTAAKIGTEDSWNERIQTLRQHGMDYLADDPCALVRAAIYRAEPGSLPRIL